MVQWVWPQVGEQQVNSPTFVETSVGLIERVSMGFFPYSLPRLRLSVSENEMKKLLLVTAAVAGLLVGSANAKPVKQVNQEITCFGTLSRDDNGVLWFESNTSDTVEHPECYDVRVNKPLEPKALLCGLDTELRCAITGRLALIKEDIGDCHTHCYRYEFTSITHISPPPRPSRN
jgi:hypothetical protein